MEEIIFYNSNRIPIMRWDDISLNQTGELHSYIFNVKIRTSIFSVSTLCKVKIEILSSFKKNLEKIYNTNEYRFKTQFDNDDFVIDMNRNKAGIIAVRIHLTEKYTSNFVDIAYQFDQSFLPELIGMISQIASLKNN